MQNVRINWRWKTAVVVLSAIAAAVYWAARPPAGIAQVNPLANPVLSGACTVYIRGDVGGVSTASVYQLRGLNTCTGKILQLNDQWLVLAGDQQPQQTWWIPRTSIALITTKP